jgi:hypothetical protein
MQALRRRRSQSPHFVNLLRSPGIDSQPGGPVKKPYLTYRPARLLDSLESIPGLLRRLQIRALFKLKTSPDRLCFAITNIVCVQAPRRRRSCTRSRARAWCTWWRRPAPPATSPSATATSSGRAAGPQRDGTGAAAGKPSIPGGYKEMSSSIFADQ